MKKDFGSKKKKRAFEFREREEKRKAKATLQKRYDNAIKNFDLPGIMQAIYEIGRT
jgi:hypothetical protein